MPHQDTDVIAAPEAATTPTENSALEQAAGVVPASDAAFPEVGLAALGRGGLRLTKLTMVGFKSFADKTEFVFDDPITGVVGPNGCGKSNLVDAIKWVLGERSSKSLRGKEMIDVIFAGSAGRKPSGMASVTLTFDNPVADQPATAEEQPNADEASTPQTDGDAVEQPGVPEPQAAHDDEPAETVLSDRRRIRRPLPYDADEVAVERQLFRDGTSKYLINGKRARLKDIRDLFLDTGIGADAYSIIEQGKVDAMLLASPMERRTIFEEAAGIAKYKQRRIEATRKLDKTETNLVRTREQLESTERRLRIVKGQAAKARRYTELADEHDALRLAIAFDQYDELRSTLEGLTSRLQALGSDRDRVRAEVTELEAEKQNAELARHEAQTAHRREEDGLRNAEHGATAAEQRGQMAKRSIEEANTQRETEQARLAETERRIEALETDTGDQRDAVAAAAERLAEAERTLEEITTSRAAALEQIAELRTAARDARGRVGNIERERIGLEGRVRSGDERLATLGEQRTKLEQKVESLTAEHGETADRLAAAERETAELERTIARDEATLERENAAANRVSSTRSDAASRVAALDEELVRLDARRATLDEMVRSRVGLGEAARAAMQRREAGEGFAGVIAPLAELIETDPRHARAIEAALGGNLRAIVIESASAMPSEHELASLPGRIRLLPLTGVAPRGWSAMHDATVEMLSARVESLRGAVRPHESAGATADRVADLLDRVLGSMVLVDSLDAAAMLAAGPLPDATFVTPDGCVLDPTGRVTAGPMNAADEQGEASGGLIERAAELTELETRLAALGEQGRVARDQLAAVDAEAAALSERRKAIETALAEHRRSLAAGQASIDRLGSDAARLDRERQSAASEASELGSRASTVTEELGGLRERVESLTRLLEEQATQAEQAEKTLADAEHRATSATEQMTAARVDVSKLSEQAGAAKRELNRLAGDLEHAKRQVEEHRRHAEEATERHARYEATFAEARAAHESLVEEAADHRAKLAQLSEALRVSEQAAQAASESLGRARDRARIVERDWNALEMTRRENEVKRENLEERTLEDLRIDLAAEHLDYRAVMAPGDVERVDIPDSQARVNVLKGEIKKLGNVNLDSIAEEDQLAERNEELIAQVADIDEARMKLATLIERLNIASKDRFGEVFETIRSQFGGQDGMFRKLFGGGRAEVRLMPLVKEVDGQKVVTDETDLLESGIEVIAKPPGKEPRSISQLSGGEKTMTAVALLLAIFRSKPSCFCVLDEVDAALDEANVGRFCSVVEEFTSFSRFIVITHNKRTMQVADHLYGITQRERGVSSRVSVKLDQVGRDGHIHEGGRAQPSKLEALPESDTDEQASPTAARPGGTLKRALAAMREGAPVEANAD